MPRRKSTAHVAFAKALADLVANTATPDAESTSGLASDILFDMSNEVGISVDHPTLVRGYVLAALDKLDNDELDGYEHEHAEEMLGHLRELVANCSEERFNEIFDHYHPMRKGATNATN